MRISVSEARKLGLLQDCSAKNGKSRRKKDETFNAGLPEPLGEIVFHIPGAPVGKARAQVVQGGAHTFTPEKTEKFTRMAKTYGVVAMVGRGPFRGPVRSEIVVVRKPPKSWSRKKKESALRGEIIPVVKPDSDNIDKAILDALNGVVYVDDKQVKDRRTIELYGPESMILLRFEAIACPVGPAPTLEEWMVSRRPT